MTLVLKSKVKSSRNLGHIDGINARDFVLKADFANNEYQFGSQKTLSSFMNFIRNNKAYAFDEQYNIIEYANNLPSLSSPDNTAGLWFPQYTDGSESIFNDLAYNSGVHVNGLFKNNSSKTYIGGLNRLYVLSVWGSGSVAISGNYEIVTKGYSNNTNIATKNNPVRFRPIASTSGATSGTVNYTVSGNVVHYQAQNGDTPGNPILSLTSRPNITFTSDFYSNIGEEYTLLLDIHRNGNTSYPSSILEIETSAGNISLYNSTSKSIGLAKTVGGVRRFIDSKLLESSEISIAVSVRLNSISLAVNGEWCGELKDFTSSKITKLTLFKTPSYSSIVKYNNILKHLVVYNRRFDMLELARLSTSFL